MNTNFDYSKTYYKVTNAIECHNGYKYRDGLNILNSGFDDNPEHSCVHGRLYFTDYEHLPMFLEYGMYIREVKIPEDARVVKDGTDKWGADRLILERKYHIYSEFDKWFDKERYNYDDFSYVLAWYFSKYFDIWFDKKRYNYRKHSDALAYYCSEHFDKWFDKDLYNYKLHSSELAKGCSKHFDKWFDKKKYNFEEYSWALARYCPEHFDKWFDIKKCTSEDCIQLLKAYYPELYFMNKV